MTEGTDRRSGVSRRALLAAGATSGALATAGCADMLGRVSPGPRNQLSVSITAVPEDDDRQTNGIWRTLESHLEAVGIDVTINLRTTHEFYRTVLIENDFDIYVGYYPGSHTLDDLYTLCHSSFENEPGWQNPFGITDMDLDALLEAQRSADGTDRTSVLADILDHLLVEKPFVPLCRPDEHRLVNSTHFEGWNADYLRTRLGYLGLEPVEETDRLTGITTDARPTLNLNPLAVHYRRRGTIVDLVYDSLGTYQDDAVVPWLASEWGIDDHGITVELREDAVFHDGVAVTPRDVVFSYELLKDLSLGRAESPIPSPRYRRERSLVQSVTALDEATVRLSTDASPDLVEDALTVPILPEHVWEPLVTDLDEATATTEEWLRDELLSDDVPRVGSGPYVFDDRVETDRLTLTRFDDHVTRHESNALPEASAEELRVSTAPNVGGAIEQVDNGSGSVTISPIEPHAVSTAQSAETATLLESTSQTFYHVGFNLRRSPFTNPHFRRAVASLLDREWLVSEVFDGFAEPIAVPQSTTADPSVGSWSGTDPEAPFAGTDGELDESIARERFENAGFRYDEEGRLVVNQ